MRVPLPEFSSARASSTPGQGDVGSGFGTSGLNGCGSLGRSWRERDPLGLLAAPTLDLDAALDQPREQAPAAAATRVAGNSLGGSRGGSRHQVRMVQCESQLKLKMDFNFGSTLSGRRGSCQPVSGSAVSGCGRPRIARLAKRSTPRAQRRASAEAGESRADHDRVDRASTATRTGRGPRSRTCRSAAAGTGSRARPRRASTTRAAAAPRRRRPPDARYAEIASAQRRRRGRARRVADGRRLPQPSDYAGGVARDISNNVRESFDPNPFGVGEIAGPSPGDLAPGGAEVVFTLALTPAVTALAPWPS